MDYFVFMCLYEYDLINMLVAVGLQISVDTWLLLWFLCTAPSYSCDSTLPPAISNVVHQSSLQLFGTIVDSFATGFSVDMDAHEGAKFILANGRLGISL
jgi:hypothetical protein